MGEMFLRQALPTDWQTIAEFNCRLAEESEGKSLIRETVEQGVRALLSDPRKGRYFVACENSGRIIGQVMHTFEWSDWRNGDIWWLQSVYVAPESRRRSVFRRLFEHVLAEARNTPEVVGLRLYVEEHNQRGQDAYLNLGFSRTSYFVMERLFTPDQSSESPQA